MYLKEGELPLRGRPVKKIRTMFFCQNCGQQSPKWLGKCPSCSEWNSFVEEEIPDADAARPADIRFEGVPQSVDAIDAEEGDRIITGIAEMDRVLGGGIVGGSAILVGGDPGIGKSTLLLQALEKMAERGLTVLYVSGEESARQIKLRAKRLGASAKGLLILVEVDLENILTRIQEIKPAVAVIDSIQTVYSSVTVFRTGKRGAGPRGFGAAHSHGQEDGDSNLPRRPCHEGWIDCRTQGPRTYG